MLALPLVASQILQRLYHIVDNHFINNLGNQALLIHSIQYNFIMFGQFVGAATATSSLIFWNRSECTGKQGSIFKKHLFLVSALTSFFALCFFFNSHYIVSQFKIDPEYLNLAEVYVRIGFLNMLLQSVYGALDGMLVASGQLKKSMFFSLILLIGNVSADYYATITLYNDAIPSPDSILNPLLFVGLSTTTFLCLSCAAAAGIIALLVDGWKKITILEIIPIWNSEMGVSLIRAVTPFIYAYQLTSIQATNGFLVTYHMALHVAYVFSLPLLACSLCL